MTGLALPAAITLHSPEGSAWEFLVLFLVVIIGPPLVQRARIPGLIGLLIGGFLIGPNGLGLLSAGSTTIPDLGQLGLLYLMFVAGVELDLSLVRKHRRSVIGFGLLTLAFPMALGTAAGFALGWSAPAAILLGSLFGSYTLVLYPLARAAGVVADPLVASAVGATVLTDTIALVILVVVAGTQTGTGSGAEIAMQLALGLSVLSVTTFLLLPRVARAAFKLFGNERAVRYVIAVAAFLGAAVVAETFGIEGIVGAFFAGLAMNRLVPSEGPLMNRIDFFGVAVFVPVFLVSVGLMLNPSVMVEPETLGLAGIFVFACIVGKLIAALLTRPLFGASAPQSWMVFAISTPQAAATLAATTVGFEIGLFSETVVNAILILIPISIVISTLVGEREKGKIAKPPAARREPGEHVLVLVSDIEGAELGLRLARATGAGCGGLVNAVLLHPTGGDPVRRQAELDRLTGVCSRLGIDADPVARVTDHRARTAILAAADFEASLVLFVEGGQAGGNPPAWEEVVGHGLVAPIAIVRGTVDTPLGRLRMLSAPDSGGPADRLAEDLIAALPGEPAAPTDGASAAEPRDGEIAILPLTARSDLDQLRPVPGAALVLIADELTPGA